MRIIITGSESFIGRELISQCSRAGIEVFGFDLLDKPSFDYEYRKADIRSPEIIDLLPKGADAIVHLAALSRDTDCKNKAQECFDINVMGTLNVMKAAEESGAKQFIFASSEWVYDNCAEENIKTEESFINILNHDSEYALSKLVSEANLKQKSNRGFCPVTIFRFGIIYGPRPNNWSAVESLFFKVNSGEQITVGSLRTGRHFIHVSDVASGIIAALEKKQRFEIYNLCSDRLVTLGDIISASKRILGKDVKIIESDPKNVSVRVISNKKVKERLRWEPKIGLEDGLRGLLA